MRNQLALVTATAAAVLFPQSADAAEPYEHVRYADTVAGSFEDCGTTFDFVDTFSGQFLVRTVAESDGQAFLAQDNRRFSTVFTNQATGRSMVVSGSGLFKEIDATHVEGNIWQFTGHNTGVFTISDLDGTRLAAERGRISFTYRFDTLGDGQPGGEFVDEDPSIYHGSFETAGMSFCDFAELYLS